MAGGFAAALPWVAGSVSPAQEGPGARRVEALAARLDSEDVAQRGRAQEGLLRLGRGVAPLLRKIVEGAPAEAAARIRAILDRFERDELWSAPFPRSGR